MGWDQEAVDNRVGLGFPHIQCPFLNIHLVAPSVRRKDSLTDGLVNALIRYVNY